MSVESPLILRILSVKLSVLGYSYKRAYQKGPLFLRRGDLLWIHTSSKTSRAAHTHNLLLKSSCEEMLTALGLGKLRLPYVHFETEVRIYMCQLLLNQLPSLKMTPALALPRRTITYESAAQHQSDTLTQLEFTARIRAFNEHLLNHASDIQDLVSHHLGLSASESCAVIKGSWKRGSFNICVPVEISRRGKPSERVIARFAIPLAGFAEIDAIDEKTECEAATFAWLQDNCPDIPTVHVFGFSFSGSTVRLRPLSLTTLCICNR